MNVTLYFQTYSKKPELKGRIIPLAVQPYDEINNFLFTFFKLDMLINNISQPTGHN